MNEEYEEIDLNFGRILWMDKVSELVPDPLCKMSKTGRCSHRLSELKLVKVKKEPIETEEHKLHKLLLDSMESFPLSPGDVSIKIVRRDLFVPKLIEYLKHLQ